MKPTEVPHASDEDGYHDEESCYACAAGQGDVKSHCRCGECYRRLLIEVLPEDALVEPRIAEKGSPLLDPPDDFGHRELIGYLLNSSANGGTCVFLDRATNLCGIYDTRPLLCRLFDCDDRDELVELGILPPRQPVGK